MDSSLKSILLKKPTPPRVGSFKEITGDLIKLAQAGKFDFIGHGCNCFASMGAGIAKFIGLAFPLMKRADDNYSEFMNDIEKLGNFSYGVVKLSKKKGDYFVGINFYSQHYPGPSFDEEALTLSLRKFAMWKKQSKYSGWRIGLPLIGCGIGGGDWNRVKEIIQKELHEFDVTIVHFNK